jgi:hypothetical protein
MRFDCISAAHGEKFGLSNLGRLAFCRSGFNHYCVDLEKALNRGDIQKQSRRVGSHAVCFERPYDVFTSLSCQRKV